MEKHEILGLLNKLVEESGTAVLATVDQNRLPHIRWITPGCIEERTGAIFIVSSEKFSKVQHIRSNPSVELMFQNPALETILNISGRANILKNPSILSETLECVGKHLDTFWRISEPDDETVVLETIIEKATVYHPLHGNHETVHFS